MSLTATTSGPIVNSQMIYDCGDTRWNDIDRRKRKKQEKTLSQCNFVHYTSHMH
jgi:hypothetical protein